jgi:tetratricopeptide (TPR) repeat protein/DNA-binding XRE family transcriptional regulator
VDVRPGSVKQARSEAGLSLGQVAGGAVSRTAIYYVETGKARPSLETLRLIAERTGRPLDFFLGQPSTMEPRSTIGTSGPELLVAKGEYRAAIESAQELLDQRPDPELAARLRYLMANAHLQLAEPAAAQPLLTAARAYFERVGDVLMIAECLGREAAGAYLLQQPGARVLAERGLELCRSLTPVPKITEGRLLSVLGGVHATNQDWPAAIEAYEQAIAAGDVIQDLRRLSLMYSGLSLAYQEVGRLSEAAVYSRRALTIHETLDDRLSLARSENNLGALLLKQGDLTDAERHIRRSLALFEEAHVEIGRAMVLTSLCELALARSDVMAAEHFANVALELAERCAEPANVAEVHQWLAHVAAARGDDARVDAEFRLALEALEELDVPERLSRCHLAYAEMLEQRGDLAEANDHLKQAIAGLRPSLIAAPRSEPRSATA